MNIGVWAKCPEEGRIRANRTIEAKVKELQGMKWLYADTFYTEEEFWSIYDREWYNALRRQYSAEHLPDVFQKVRTIVTERVQPGPKCVGDYLPHRWLQSHDLWNRWPLVGITAVLSFLRGVDYLKAAE